MYVKIRVQTEAKREEIRQIKPDHFEVSVKEPAKQNLANKRAMELVALHFKIPVKKVKIVSGHHSPSKIFSIMEK